jgi:hypothetical protein
MLRRLMLLTTLLALVGVFVLCAPVLADNSAQLGKATIQTTTGKPSIVQTSPSKAAASMQPSSTRSNPVGTKLAFNEDSARLREFLKNDRQNVDISLDSDCG